MVAPDANVCARCGLEVVLRPYPLIPLHVEQPGEHWEPHDVEETTTRAAYLFGEQEKADSRRSPLERQADAQERIAGALERIADRLTRS